MRSFYRRVLGRAAVAERFVLEDVAAPAPPIDPAVALRRIAAEAVILQDRAEVALDAIRRRESLGVVAPDAGPLVRRFFALQDQLPAVVPQSRHASLRDEMSAILHHHALALSVAMDFLAQEGRSAALARQVDGLTDLGRPARRLDEIRLLLGEGA